MSAKKRGLGRGLDALLASVPVTSVVDTDDTGELRMLPVDLLQRGSWQPRTDFDDAALQEMAESIRTQGVLQPILVRPLDATGKFEIIAGERRWRAAQLAGLHEIPSIVRELDEQATLCIALIENMQRKDLNPLEQAQGLSRLLDEFGMTHDGIARAVGRSRPAVTNLLRLMDLNDEVKKLLQDGQLEMAHARTLLSLPEAGQKEVARQIIKSGLSVRATEALVRRLRQEEKTGDSGKKQVDPNIRQLETELSERLGTAVTIQQQTAGKGTLRIAYGSLAQLDGILARIRKK